MDKKDTSSAIIAVDLDGTLIHTDILIECLIAYLKKNPLGSYKLFFYLLKGKAHLKRKLSENVDIDEVTLPYNLPLIDWLKYRRSSGCSIVLASASHIKFAKSVSDYLGIFDEVYATDTINLDSARKATKLVSVYGVKGFEYIGNSMADLQVWNVCSVVHISDPEFGVLKAAKKSGQLGIIFNSPKFDIRIFFKAIRFHQWIKNLLIFVPLLASHQLLDKNLWTDSLLAFIAFGLTASSVYLTNDLLDLPEDRRHRSKSKRPLASGRMSIKLALLIAPFLLLCAVTISGALSTTSFLITLAFYYISTLLYSFFLKKVAILDTLVLAMLYTVRVIAGANATELTVTFWILAFCLFIFYSLAILKRYTELYHANKMSQEYLIKKSRGYEYSDYELLASIGGSAGLLSVLVLALYINEQHSLHLYARPEILYATCPLLLYWISRSWLIAHRGEMHDDPIVYAIKDPISRIIGALFIILFYIATTTPSL